MLIVLACVVIFVPIAVFAAVSICASLPRKGRAAECIIVLGAMVRADGSMGSILEARCKVALQAWRKGMGRVLILTGGRGRNGAQEAGAMKRFFLKCGVPEAAILTEDSARNTRENIEFAGELMRDCGLKTALLVTSDYHMTRALWIARDAGLKVKGLSAPLPRGLGRQLKCRLQETMSWFRYGFGKIFR